MSDLEFFFYSYCSSSYLNNRSIQDGEGSAKKETKAEVPLKESNKKAQDTAEVKKAPYIPPPYEPKLPFPGRCKKELLAKYQALFDKQIAALELKMPLLDACALMPKYEKFLKGAVLNMKKELQEQEQEKALAVESQECKAVVQEEVIKDKLEDRSFVKDENRRCTSNR